MARNCLDGVVGAAALWGRSSRAFGEMARQKLTHNVTSPP
jgi:hypothetical protein